MVSIKFKQCFKNCLYLVVSKYPKGHISRVLSNQLISSKINYQKIIQENTLFDNTSHKLQYAFTVVRHKSPKTFKKRQKFQNVMKIFRKRYTFFFSYL